jgi:hypothetical protein
MGGTLPFTGPSIRRHAASSTLQRSQSTPPGTISPSATQSRGAPHDQLMPPTRPRGTKAATQNPGCPRLSLTQQGLAGLISHQRIDEVLATLDRGHGDMVALILDMYTSQH